MAVETPVLIRQVRACRTRWRLILVLAVAGLLGAIGWLRYDGLGRVWEAQTRLGVETVGGGEAILPILRARAQSGDVARALSFAPSTRATATGQAVLDLKVRALTAQAAIEGANRLAEYLVDEQARLVDEHRLALHRREWQRQAWIEREMAALAEQLAPVKAVIARLDQELPPALKAAEAAVERAARDPSQGLIRGDTPEERRLQRLERERERSIQTIERLEARRGALQAPQPLAEPAPPRLTLLWIDRAVGATRTPVHVWQSLLAGPLLGATCGILWALTRTAWLEATAHERRVDDRIVAATIDQVRA